MDRSLETKAWRRSFAAGCAALALSVGGQAASSRRSCEGACPFAAEPGLAEQVIARLKPAVRAHGGVAQRVALAVLGAVLHSHC